ncbi:uncharacterized protein [Anabrus simplex]|uniref:uncharacterized protein n=1 Tax=Anabrus simplex TaxID=316456 RepID=UPI0035A330DA
MSSSSRLAASLLALFVLLALLAPISHAAPYSRQKRVSDQRLAELETMLALNRLKGRLVTVPVGFGKVDPNYLGRRRRSDDSMAAETLSDEELSDLLDVLRRPVRPAWLPDWSRALEVQ